MPPFRKASRQGLNHHRGLCTVVIVLACFVTVASPSRGQDRDADHRESNRRADLSRLVIIGDSLSAGFQNDSLLDSQQPHGYASLIAAQADVSLALPLIARPGIPNVLELVSAGPPPILTTAPGTSIGRDNPAVQPTDLAVPGAALLDVLTTRPSFPITPSDILTDLILGIPGASLGELRSQLEWVEALHPTTIIAWAGNEDVLAAAISANPALVTPIPDFKDEYSQLMDCLAATGASLVVANIPDVTIIPFLTPTEDLAEEVGLPVSLIEPILGIGPGDFVTPDAIPLVLARLANPSLGPLPSNVVLTAAAAQELRAVVDAYNEIIEAEARKHGAAVVYIHRLTNLISKRGIEANGQILTTEYLGGIFSLDGVHPTNTGYAVIANAFIRALDLHFDANLEPVSVDNVAKSDPLVLPGIEPPDSIQSHVDPDTSKSMRRLFANRRAH